MMQLFLFGCVFFLAVGSIEGSPFEPSNSTGQSAARASDRQEEATEKSPELNEQLAQFWKAFQGLEGKAFSGKVLHAPEGDTTFSGKPLVIYVKEASDDRIAIHFFVGDDRSRTWLLTRVNDRIQLKHDHRHEDGSEDEVTQYGGLATNTGSSNRQVFPADQQTAKMLPAAAANVWWIDINAGEHYTYNMRRLGTDRYFSVRFDLKTEIARPAAAWGWEEQ